MQPFKICRHITRINTLFYMFDARVINIAIILLLSYISLDSKYRDNSGFLSFYNVIAIKSEES